MPNKIKRSWIRGDFQKGVEEYVKELNSHVGHMKMVDEGKAQAYPPPQAPAEIVAAISLDEKNGLYFSDFEIVEDGPTPEQQLRSAKDELLARVTQMEVLASNYIAPPGKRRKIHIRHGDAVVRVARESLEDGTLRKIGNKIGLTSGREFTRDEQAAVSEAEALVKGLDAVSRHAAELHSQIEDLTQETIAGWKPSPFPTKESKS